MAEIVIFSDVNGALGFSRYAGPYRIASELRQHGFDVQVIDFFASLSLDQILKIIETHVNADTLFVGFSATLWTKYMDDDEILETFSDKDKSLRSIIVDGMVKLFPRTEEEMNEIFLEIKIQNKNAKIVVGGYKATNYDTFGVDYWVLGQGEQSAVHLAKHLKYGDELKAIATDWGQILTDKIYPYNNFHRSQILWHKNDFLFEGENIPIEIARGCVFKCSFCAFNLNGKKFGDYTKTADVLREELIRNYELYGITEYMMTDDTLNDSMVKIKYLYDVIESLPFKINFSCYSRLDVLAANLEMAPMLQQMGCVSIEFGIETMNEKTGRYIGKQGNRQKIIENLHTLKNIWKDNIYIAAGFIVGLPYEDEKSIRTTMDWLYEKNNPLSGIQLNRYWFQKPPFLPKKLGDKYNLQEYGFNLTPAGWVYENVSKIYENPTAYGYTDESSDWSNNYLNAIKATELEKEFYQSPFARQKKSMSIFQYYNRMRNIGYNHTEIGQLYYDDIPFIKEAISRKSRLKKEYLSKIL